tara:strand:+ start:16488 stop:16922 length:435 start_codon:yes stop_codon:yes gene_type:complete
MGRVTVHLLGRPKDRAIAAVLSDYESRLKGRGIHLQIHAEKLGREGYERKLSALQGTLILLDERGASTTSEGLASWLSASELERAATHLAVGPIDGFSENAKTSANSIISLSELTLTHEMAAALLLEQLYRASEINRGSPYHRG